MLGTLWVISRVLTFPASGCRYLRGFSDVPATCSGLSSRHVHREVKSVLKHDCFLWLWVLFHSLCSHFLFERPSCESVPQVYLSVSLWGQPWMASGWAQVGFAGVLQARVALRYCWVSSLSLLNSELGLYAQLASQSPGGTQGPWQTDLILELNAVFWRFYISCIELLSQTFFKIKYGNCQTWKPSLDQVLTMLKCTVKIFSALKSLQ